MTRKNEDVLQNKDGSADGRFEPLHLRLRRDCRILHARYLQGMKKKEPGSADDWLCDNYRLLRDAAHTVREALADRRQAHRLMHAARVICPEACLPEASVLCERAAGCALSARDCEKLSAALLAELLHFAAQAVAQENDEMLIAAIRSFFALRETDFDALLPQFCETEALLRTDPAGLYSDMDDATRHRYRMQVTQMASEHGKTEASLLGELLAKAQSENRHIGFYLGFEEKKPTVAVAVTAAQITVSVGLSVLLALSVGRWFLCFLLLLPVYALLAPIFDAAALRLSTPQPLLSMQPKREIPEQARTAVTVTGILPRADEAAGIRAHLQELYDAACYGAVQILYLADFAPADSPEMPSDASDLDAMRRVIDGLNRHNGGGFALAVRPRVFSATQNQYTGRERKRGALLDLACFLNGEPADVFCELYGDTQRLRDTKYILTLDSDTSLTLGTLADLCAAAMHPLNHPQTDAAKTRVVKGYGVFVPGICPRTASEHDSLFSVLMTDGGGISAYSQGATERNMQLFGHSIFTGKGLLNASVFAELCARRFPDQTVLSHDIPEGGILRTAFDGRGGFTEGFPQSVRSYYERMHRWLRGDWQNSLFLFRSLGTAPLPWHTRWLLGGNIRRALTPIAAFVLLGCALTEDGARQALLAGIAVLSVAADELWRAVTTLWHYGAASLTKLYFSPHVPGVAGAFVRALLLIALLPQTAWCCASAAALSLWRMAVSRKNLLAWKTAARSDRFAENKYFQYLVFPLLTSVLLFTGGSTARAAALFFAVGAVFCLLPHSVRLPSKKKLSAARTDQLITDCAAMWRFFEDCVTETDSFLPPDNLQEIPVRKIAHRTSPTNIGLYLCCILAAADLSFIDAQGLLLRVRRTLDSVCRLEKKYGNLLNWYDTRTLRALPPRYVSTVDSGNFLCCLTALSQGLREYVHACPPLAAEIERIEKLIEDTRLQPLYNESRRLFCVGMDADTEERSRSCYDLYMSEARMTSYFAVSSGAVPPEHWSALARTRLRGGRHAGAASWTGTFFEYFMPCLFLPTVPNSFAAENLSFCLYMQKKHAARENIPWGISESGFYSFDSAVNYAYKAHGVSGLCLKRNADCENVVAPYATYLALPVFTDAAVRNLDRLRALHLGGRYGLCEAADFCKERTDGEDYRAVRSYMAHHVGMSMLSVCNAVSSDSFVRRFMRSRRTAAGVSLLAERVPVSLPLRCVPEHKKDGERPVRREKANAVGKHIRFASNGEWTALCDRRGRNVQIFSAVRVLRNRSQCGGVTLAAHCDGRILPLTGHASVQTRFTRGSAESAVLHSCVRFRSLQAVHPSLPAALFAVRADNEGETEQKAGFCFYLEPSLLPVFERERHPAFEKLFLHAHYDDAEKIVLFSRRNTEQELALAVGFYDRASFSFETDREKVLSRGGAQRYPITDGFTQLQNGISGTDRCLAVYLPVHLNSRQSREHTLILCVGANAREAADRLQKIRSQALPEAEDCARNPFSDAPSLLPAAETLCAGLFFDAAPSPTVCAARQNNTLGKETLWKSGLSGDRPLAVLETHAENENSLLESFVRLHGKLCMMGIPVDFLFLRGRTGGYSESAQEVLRQTVRRVGFSHPGAELVAVQKNTLSEQELTAVYAFAECVFPTDFSLSRVPRILQPLRTLPVGATTQQQGFGEGGYRFSEQPAVPWCITQANPVFGFLASDRSPGCSWAGNAQRNKLTPWENDTRSMQDGELLLLSCGQAVYSLTDGASVLYTDTCACYGGKTDVFSSTVHLDCDRFAQKKRLTVKIRNTDTVSHRIRLAFAVRPVLAADGQDAVFVRAQKTENGILLCNPVNADVPGVVLLSADVRLRTVFGQQALADALIGKESDTDISLACERSAVLAEKELLPDETFTVRFFLCFARTVQAVNRLYALPFRKKVPQRTQFSTGDALLDVFGEGLLLSTVRDTRLFARCGFYQCGGAWGFRDQLQDAMCLLPYAPHLTRRQLLRCAAVQFEEGDVLHWHHALFPRGAQRAVLQGVRTRCSDDYLWLVFVTAAYLEKTKDTSVLQVKIPYLHAEVLQENEKDRYAVYAHSDVKETLYGHCLRALARAFRFGAHGLPLMEGGDWNDAMGAVGEKGQGESVWLAMFLAMTLDRFADVCHGIADVRNEHRLRRVALILRQNIDRHAWSGDRYLRAFFDDGMPLGDQRGTACKIDLLPQSFAVFCAMPDKKRVRAALATAFNTLFDAKSGTVRLFDGAFTPEMRKAGYINFYPPGVRENGGQYTHAAVWFALALLRAGYREQAMQIARAICPAAPYRDGMHTEEALRYRAEPYAPCGDVSTSVGMCGRGGWSLYTGSAGWFLQLLRELGESCEK